MAVVFIHFEDKEGRIIYDPENLAGFKVEFSDEAKREEIETYLKSEREFWIPESNEIDDYRIDKARPIDDVVYFELALSSLYGQTRVFVRYS
jgi:hypothetical protein